jgi:protein-disulfide isomerase
VLVIALLGVIGVAVAVVLIVAFAGKGSSSSSATGTTLPDANFIAQQLDGIPQRGDTLGRADAPVTMVEYIDLQCPVCREFETSVMPTVIRRYVRTGKVKVIARPIAFIGPDSERGRRGMIAAALQNRGFNFSQLLYFNQGPENGGWLNDDMVASAATSIPGVDVKALQDTVNSSAVTDQTKTIDSQAQADQVTGTPTILVGKSDGKLTALPAGNPGLPALSSEIQKALGQ